MIRAAMDESFAGVVVTDAAGVIEYVNSSFETTSGYCAAELIGRPIAGLSANELLDQSVWAVLSADGHWRGEIKNKRSNGEVYHLLATIQALRSEDGEITHYIGVNIDITERVKAEEELAEREAYWRALVENAPSYITVVDRDGTIESLNKTVAGACVEDAIGRSMYEYLPDEEHAARWRSALTAAFESGLQQTIENRGLDGAGKMRWYSNSIGPVYERGEVTAAIAVAIDITERKEAEGRMRAIATAIADVIVVVDEDGLLLEVLAPTKKEGLLLRPPEELRGMRIHEFMPKDQVERTLEFVRATISSGRPREDEMLVDLPQGPTWLSARSAPLSLGDGRVVAVIHVLDVSGRKRLEEELQRLREETEAEAEEGVKRASEYGLTFREITVLSLIARGKSDKEIAALLGLSPFTVNKHSSHLVRKLGARSRSQAAARAVREGII